MDILREFLDKHVRGYLLCDVEQMSKISALGNGYGACGYPMLMALLAGIELIGVLYSDASYNDRSKSNTEKYFPLGWNLLFSDRETYSKEDVRKVYHYLLRHGLMHLYLSKIGVFVVKSGNLHNGKDEGGNFVVNVDRFYQDFKESYLAIESKILTKEGSVQRLIEIFENMKKDSDENLKFLNGIPTSSDGGVINMASNIDVSASANVVFATLSTPLSGSSSADMRTIEDFRSKMKEFEN
jgi:hypothetical protein